MTTETNAERLERCKKFANAEDVDWLIEQVERANKADLRTGEMRAMLIHQKQENAHLRKALDFYAERDNWKQNMTGKDLTGKRTLYYSATIIEADKGKVARKALE